jgi:hypothetical protein
VLIENVEEASKILFEGGRVRNVRRCLCIDARDRRRGVTLSYGRTGEPSQAPIAPYVGRPRMKSDIDSQIRYGALFDVINSAFNTFIGFNKTTFKRLKGN